jgi:glyoxylase-like metal-dependent hydrolase (beta-lactamase superfamily II)
MKRKIIAGLLLGAITAGGFASESDGIYSMKVGQIEVFMLVEGQRAGNAGILVGADQETLERYIPKTGFTQSTNAFLIKTPGQIILVDTGTGAGGIVLEKMQKLGVAPEQVDAILITHLHGDHFGSLQKDGGAVFSKARIFLASKEHEYFTKTNVNQGVAAALAPYSNRITAFNPGSLSFPLRELLPGISAIANYGHTPGHTVFLVENGRDKLIIAGDFLHIAPVQFPVPDISASYDTDPAAAAASRRQILDYAAKNKIPIGGMHIAYPGIGSVESAGNGYRFTPVK